MIKELISSVSGNLRERASSPILGTYTIAVTIISWKALVVLFTSDAKGMELVTEIQKVAPKIEVLLIYPIAISVFVSIAYPTIKALVSAFNTYSRVIEIKAEYRLEEIKERLSIKQDPIETLIRSLSQGDYYEKIGYHDLKRLLEYLPDEESLLIKKRSEESANRVLSNKPIQPTVDAAAD